ncbi:MAG TPA: phosphatase PAP2 family protein [Thermomonas sp.]|nr:phosphatase PAP2 family protein [Thermomonas sp.]
MPPPAWAQPAWQRAVLWGPLAFVAILLVAVATFDIDQRVADMLYALEGQRWALKGAIATDLLIHLVGRDLSVVAGCAAVATWIWSLQGQRGRPWRKPLGYLVLSTVLATTLVAWIKTWSNMDCPWDLLRYGGTKPFVGLLHLRPVGLQRGYCFPAAHAGAGYAWVSLYFFLGVVRPEWKTRGLVVGLGIGLLFGISQQLRGAHFVSHDLSTFAICWGTAAGLYCLFWPAQESRHDPAPAPAGRPA